MRTLWSIHSKNSSFISLPPGPLYKTVGGWGDWPAKKGKSEV